MSRQCADRPARSPTNQGTNTCHEQRSSFWQHWPARPAGGAPAESSSTTDSESLTGTCSASTTTNTYDGANYWGTITVKNDGASAWKGFSVSFDAPSGAHCTNDSVPSGATLSPLNGSGPSASTLSNRCAFTWANSTVAAGASKTFNYSTDSASSHPAANLKVSSASCGGSGGTGSGGGTGSSGSGSSSSGGGSSSGSSDAGGGPVACPALTSGWTPYNATTKIQFEGAGTSNQYCSYSNTGGVEHFKMEKNPAGVIQRCEARIENDYLSGSNQFEGDVQIISGDNTCVHQVFMFLMLVAYPQNGGELHQHGQTPLLPGGVFGNWIHVNTIHNTSTHQADIYVDCVHKLTMADAPPQDPAGWYDKYGLYGIQHLPPVGQVSEVYWKNIHLYRR